MPDYTPTERMQLLKQQTDALLRAFDVMRRECVKLNIQARQGGERVAAQAMIAVRASNEAIGEAVTELNKLRQELQTQIVPELFQRANVSSLTVDDNRVTISAKLSVVMTDKVGGMEWLKANDLGDLIQETVNAQTLAASIRKLMEDKGIEPPDDKFTCTPVMNTSVTKVKKK